MQERSVTARQDEDGGFTIQVPNKRIARLLQLGIHAEVENKRRTARRKQQKASRRRNRKG